MLQLYLTPGERLGNIVVFTVGPGVRFEGEGVPTGSRGWQDSWYPISTPLVTAGVCHEKLNLFVITDVIWNIRGGSGATKGGNVRVLTPISKDLVVCTYDITNPLTLVPCMV